MFKRLFSVVILFSLLLNVSCGIKNDNVVYVYNWGEYIDPTVIDMFEDETGIKVVYDMFETNEEMYPIIERGAAEYDVICPSEYMIDKMIQNDLLLELNIDELKYYENIDEKQISILSNIEDGEKYAVPYMRGTVGILYNKTILDEKQLPYPERWSDLFNPIYADEILMQDSVRDAFMVALKKNGFSMNTGNSSELDIATKDLTEQKPIVQAYVVDQVRDKMISGEAAIGVIYSGEVLYIQGESEDNGYEFKYVLPREGTNEWLDGWVIAKNSKNVENAHKWIDFMCREDIAVLNAKYITYETPNKKAKEMLEDEYILKGDILLDYTSSNNEVFKYLGEDVEKLYSDRWKVIKGN